MIRNVVFDMGGVLIRFDRKLFLARAGVTEPGDMQLLMTEVFISLEWALMDRGAICEQDAIRRVCRRLPAHLHDAASKLIGLWDRPILPIAGMEPLIAELKEAGCGIYLLSNASLRQHDYWPRIPASRYFDGTLVSADVGLVKPQPEIYRLLFDTFSLNPAECCFIDDLPMNVEGAHYVGMPGIVFHGDVPKLRRALIEHGLPIRPSCDVDAISGAGGDAC